MKRLKKKKSKKPSWQQLNMLRNIKLYADPYFAIYGQSRMGGASGTIASLQKNGWARFDGRHKKWVITPAGAVVSGL